MSLAALLARAKKLDAAIAKLEAAPAALEPGAGAGAELVYFVQAGGPDGAVKIGRTTSLPRRLRELRTAASEVLRVLLAVPGGAGLERELHARFAPLHREREWFTPGPELLAHIAERAAEGIDTSDLERIAAAREDVNAWCEYFSGQPQAPYHRELQAEAAAHPYLLVEAAPEVGKSQQLTLRRVLWLIGRDPNITIGIVGAKAEQAFEWVRAIKSGIESPAFQRVFPEVQPGALWTTERLEVKRTSVTTTSPTVQGIGIGGSFLGARLNLIVLDDVLNAINTATKEQRSKVLEWIDSSMCVGRLLAGGQLQLLANTWTSDDAVHELSKRTDTAGAPIYTYRRDPLPDPDDPGVESPLPEIWPLERLRERKALIGPSRYKWQYELHPRGEENSRFDPAWFETHSPFKWTAPTAAIAALVVARDAEQDPAKRKALAEQVRKLAVFVCAPDQVICIGMDLGIGLTSQHDQTAWVVYMRDGKGTRHVLYVEKARLTGPKLIERMAVLEASYRNHGNLPPVFRVETVAAQAYLAQFARERLSAAIAAHTTTGNGESITNKAWGVEQLAVRCEAGQVLLARDARGSLPPAAAGLRDGLIWYTPKEHTGDDVMALLFAEVQILSAGGAWIPPVKPSEPSGLAGLRP